MTPAVTPCTHRPRGGPLVWIAAIALSGCAVDVSPAESGSTTPMDSPLTPTSVAGSSPIATARPATSDAPTPLPAGPSQLVDHGDRASNEVALTFTVGYRLDPAVAIVELLRDRRAAATIFMSGVVFDRLETRATARRVIGIVEQLPELIQLGQHGYAATELTQLDTRAIEMDVLRAQRTIGEYATTDLRPYFSPPGGAWSPAALDVLGELGYTTSVLWDVDPLDWMPPEDGGPSPDEIVDRVLGGVQGGSIVLLHLGGWNTAEALPAILDGLAQRGYRTVTIADLLEGG